MSEIPEGWKTGIVRMTNFGMGGSDFVHGWINPQGEFTIFGPNGEGASFEPCPPTPPQPEKEDVK